MFHERQAHPKSVSAGLLVGLLLVLPLLYVLSVGPTACLQANDLVADDIVIACYRPLFAVASSCQPLASFLVWYVHLWGGAV